MHITSADCLFIITFTFAPLDYCLPPKRVTPLNHRNYPRTGEGEEHTHHTTLPLFPVPFCGLWSDLSRRKDVRRTRWKGGLPMLGVSRNHQEPNRNTFYLGWTLSPAKQKKSGLGPRSLWLQSISRHGKMGAGGTLAALEKKNRIGCQVLLPPSILQHSPAPRWSLFGVHYPRPAPSGILFLNNTQTQRPSADTSVTEVASGCRSN